MSKIDTVRANNILDVTDKFTKDLPQTRRAPLKPTTFLDTPVGVNSDFHPVSPVISRRNIQSPCNILNGGAARQPPKPVVEASGLSAEILKLKKAKKDPKRDATEVNLSGKINTKPLPNLPDDDRDDDMGYPNYENVCPPPRRCTLQRDQQWVRNIEELINLVH